MHPAHVELVKGFLLRKFRAIHSWMSCLDPPPIEALRVLSNQEEMTELLNDIMARFGHGTVPARGGELSDSRRNVLRRSAGIRRSMARPRGENLEHEEAEA